jgi:RNA polymerase sigma factor (sigma-70 family)
MANGPLGSALEPLPRTRLGEAEGPSDQELLERFIKGRDEEAFAALVHRYGPLVLGVCRRVLPNWEDAQDAFQVTFLVLASKADTLKEPGLLGHWLYGVAYRTAVKARSRTARQRACERQAAGMLTSIPERSEDGREVFEFLDEELNLLPERYRILLVLCYLQGKTHEQAAQALGCPVGSMSWRLARAREMLRKRLSRRGLLFPAGLVALLLAQGAARAAAVPPVLAASTVKAAVGFAVGQATAAAGLSPSALALATEILSALSEKQRGGWGAAVVVAVLLTLLGGGLFAYRVWGGEPTAQTGSQTGASPTPRGGCGRH